MMLVDSVKEIAMFSLRILLSLCRQAKSEFNYYNTGNHKHYRGPRGFLSCLSQLNLSHKEVKVSRGTGFLLWHMLRLSLLTLIMFSRRKKKENL